MQFGNFSHYLPSESKLYLKSNLEFSCMPKLLTKFYKLSESWLKTAEIASGIYAYLTVF
jgi:hypothetical protein